MQWWALFLLSTLTMLSMPSLRVRIVGATVLGVAIILFVCAPTSMVDVLLGSAGDPPQPTPPELHTASQDVPTSQTVPGSLDALVVDIGGADESRSTSADVDHRVAELIDDVLAGDMRFGSEWTGQCLSCDAADGGSGFAQGGLPFLLGGGGSGGPAMAMGETARNQSSASSAGGDSAPGRGRLSGEIPIPGGNDLSEAPEATLEFRPVTDGDDFTVELVLETEGGPNPGGDAPWSDPPLNVTEPNTPVDPTPVPEPATLVLTGLGVAGLVARNRRALTRRTRKLDRQIPNQMSQVFSPARSAGKRYSH
jgi:hypothetical protein